MNHEIRPIKELIESGITPDELASLLDQIAINYARMSLKEGAQSSVRNDSPEEVYWLFELRNVFKEISILSQNH